MINKIILIILTTWVFNTHAQVSQIIAPDFFYIVPEPEYISINSNHRLSAIAIEKSFLEKTYLNEAINGQFLELEKESSSPTGTHLRFRHFFKGLPVYQSFVQASYSKDGKLFSIINALVKFDEYKEEEKAADFWVNTSIGLVKGYLSTSTDNHNQPVTNIYSVGGKLLQSYHQKLYLEGPDTMVTAMVYLPNPIVAANTNYGGDFVDNNDKNTAGLTNARSKVRVPVKFINGKFILTDGIIKLKNLYDPVGDPVEPKDTFINFTRDQSGFEDINVYYHLKSFSDYLRKTGFRDMLDTIIVDPHGENGDDNSSFDPESFALQYGTGGVDDGEDGQVVLHEFGHSISFMGSPGTVNGSQRDAMEEGQADYIAMSYSRSLSPNRPNDVFSWDGHNEFWDGFVTNSPRQYKNLTNLKDLDREIWSTGLMCIWDRLGRAKSDSLILSYFYFQAGQTTMPQMARVILKIDTILFKGKNSHNIWECFANQGILAPNKIQMPIKASDIRISNTSEFANGLAPARITSSNPELWSNIEIYNNIGQNIISIDMDKETFLYPQTFIPGVYYLKIISKDETIIVNKKIIRY